MQLDKPEIRGRAFQRWSARCADKAGKSRPLSRTTRRLSVTEAEISYSRAVRNYVEKDELWDLTVFLKHREN